MYTVIIVEDEVHILKHMDKMLSSMNEFVVKGVFLTPEEALTDFPNILPDVAFLDIEMPRINGIELARQLLVQKSNLMIIFTTAYSNYALDAFEVAAVDYLMKPVMHNSLERVLERLNKITGMKKVKNPPLKEDKEFIVRCFGCFDIRDQHQQLIKWSTKKAEELFAFFVVNQGKYISKWELLETFWGDMEEERGAHNLYNTIYRIKQVLKTLPLSPQIQKINEGYVLKAQNNLSDLGNFLELMKNNQDEENFSLEVVKNLLFSYSAPLFGVRDYLWSFPMQKYVTWEYGKLCRKLILYYYDQNQFSQAEEVIRYYINWHIEDEDIMQEWLKLVSGWKGQEGKADKYRKWFNEKLKETELPLLK